MRIIGYRRRRRGTTLLFVTGFSAVLFTITFLVGDRALRSFQAAALQRDQAQAQWAARAGLAYLRNEGPVVDSTTRHPCGAGFFEVSIATDNEGKRLLVAKGYAPAINPRASVTLGVAAETTGTVESGNQ